MYRKVFLGISYRDAVILNNQFIKSDVLSQQVYRCLFTHTKYLFMSNIKTCLECGEKVVGRIDKKFC